MRILMRTYIRILTQLRTATCKVLMKPVHKTAAVLAGLGCVLGCGAGDGPGGGGAVLAGSGGVRGIQGSETL